MKKLLYVLFILVFVSTYTLAAQDNEVVYIKSVKFVTPLLEKWISEYTITHPGVRIIIADKNVDPEDVDINLAISDVHENLSPVYSFSFSIGRYAVLPIAGKNNTLLNELQKKKLNGKRLKELFFERDMLDEDYDASGKDKYNATVYSINNSVSASYTFADHFGSDLSGLKGKKISGDDIYLINAVQKDNTGVSFNYLNYLYDINSRQLKDNIAILPLDLEKEHNKILSEANLDKTIALLESKSIHLIPVEEFAFVFQNKITPEIQQFLYWVLSEGQTYNHQFGFLKLDEKTLAQQLTSIKQ
jgi:ABC-type phosphate transport system substrate-binding protein